MGSSRARIIITFLLFGSIFVLPWWLLGLLLLLFFIKIENFYEGLGLALAYDIYYSVTRDFFNTLPVFFIFFCLFFLLCKVIKRQLRI